MRARPSPAEHERWRRLCDALLPHPLRKTLAEPSATLPTIVVVPDGLLAALPWSALRLKDHRPLVRVVAVQLIPSLSVLDTPTDARTSVESPLLAYLGPHRVSTPEHQTLAKAGAAFTTTGADFLNRLSTTPTGTAYIAAHGHDHGFHQRVIFDDNSELSAASALLHVWPDTVVFASCLVGRVALVLGQEPLGLPVSCLLGGSTSVIGGVIKVNDAVTGSLASRVALRVASGEHPVIALRSEQQRYLDGRATPASPNRWAGLICMSRSVASSAPTAVVDESPGVVGGSGA